MDPALDRDWPSYLSMAIECANDAVIIYGLDPSISPPFRIRYVNPAFEEQTGYSRAEVVGQSPTLLYGPRTDTATVSRLSGLLLLAQSANGELLKYRKDGTTFWSEVAMRPMTDAAGRLVGIVSVHRDITERKLAQRQAELLSMAMDQASDAMAIFEWREPHGWGLSYVNETFLRLTGYRRDEVIGRTSDFMVGPETDAEALHRFRVALVSGEPVRGEIAFYRADGSVLWTELNGRPLADPQGEMTSSIIVYRDVTERRRRVAQLTFEAAHDPLTGIFNRRYFVQALEGSLTDEPQRSNAILFFDLDGFKPVNDRYGHEAGDRLLVELTSVVSARLRRGDVFARIGGDEFAVLLAGCTQEQAERIADTLLAGIREFAFLWEGHVVRVGASIGIVCIDERIVSAADVLRAADEACYAAKRGGRNRVVVGAAR